jgi:Tat protein translocase TatB subunit
MPQVGPFEILVVAVVALIVFGPEKLPDIARTIGRSLADFRRVVDEAKEEFQSGLSFEDDEPDHPMNEVLQEPAHRSETRDRFEATMNLTEIPDQAPSALDAETSTDLAAPSPFTPIPTSLEPPREEPHDV